MMIGRSRGRHAVAVWAVALVTLAGTAAFAGEGKLFLGPYLSEPGARSMTVQWISGSADEATLRWGKGEARDKEMKLKPARETVLAGPKDQEPKAQVYVAKLTELEPATGYGYEVRCGESSGTGSFKTLPEGKAAFTFIAYGDTRNGPEIHRKLAARFAAHNPAFILHTGDMVNGGNYAQWQSFYFEPLAGVINNLPVAGVIGNHESGYDRFTQLFELPGARTYYSFDCGDAHFVALDSGVEGMSAHREYAKAQLEWCEKDLAASKARWKIVAYHRASYDVGHHHSEWFRKTHLPLFRKYGVDLTITSHSHSYQRFHPMFQTGVNDKHPIAHLISAGGGAPVEGFKPHPYLACGQNAHHYMAITVDGGKLSGKAYSPDGKELDSFQIVKNGDGSFAEEYLKSALPEENFSKANAAPAK